jgi:uncharacterized repeat protein (TIGR03803 family)
MRNNCDELGKRVTRSAAWRQALRKYGVGLAGVALVCGRATTAWADWTPPESSVTPPAVLTLDAFAAADWNGANPSAALVVGPDGALYGSTYSGGTNVYYGTLFRLGTNGTFTKLHDFDGNDGERPSVAMVMGPDGALYGSTPSGGITNGGWAGGTLFRLETNGTFTKLHVFNFADGTDPLAALVVGPDGALYGSTSGGGTNGYGFGNGTLFRLETNGAFTKLHDFNGADGAIPSAALVVGPDGALYGSTQSGGNSGDGTLFRLETNGTFTKLHDFDGTDGHDPSAALVVGPDGALYGSTYSGGTNGGYGTLFRLQTDGTFTKLHDFNLSDGGEPSAALVVGPDGALYGSTHQGGADAYFGTLFRLETDGTFTKLYDFKLVDGAYPTALVVGPDGALYGSTWVGGNNALKSGGDGTLFRLETDGVFTKLHDFIGSDGAYPTELVVGPDGALYGSTQSRGAGVANDGTLFRLGNNGTFTKLHDFNEADGSGPMAALVLGPDGALYGSTQGGGHGGNGTLFRVQTNGTFTKLHDFNITDGAEPFSALVVGPDGALYGSTQSGGANGYYDDYNRNYHGYGTLFRLETNGMFTSLHNFNGPDGAGPSTALVVGPDGALYGSTVQGGNSGWGTLFRVQTNGNFTKLHDFNATDGYWPSAALVVGPDGALYGSAPNGGTIGYGTLFRLETNGTFTKLHDFNQTDGNGPTATLVVGPDGALYGSTQDGGTNGYGNGTLFRVQTNGTFTKLHHFNGTDGSYPSAALVVGPDGAVYGLTPVGGINDPSLFGGGTLFRVETSGAFTKLHDFDYGGFDGSSPWAALVVAPDGALYGSTQHGANNAAGALFRLETNGNFTKLYGFYGYNGANPSTSLVVGPDGALYGSTPNGGPRQGGILFKLLPNQPPVARCHDVTVSAGPNCVADASVDNGSFDADGGDSITLRQDPPGPYALGVTRVTLTVTDNHGASDSCSATVTVVDTTPPTISGLTVTPNVLWPPDGKMVEVTVNYTASDDCGAVSQALSVTSNDASGGSGHRAGADWVIKDDHHVLLRAERSGQGIGRVYAITVIATDSTGNWSTKRVTVTVPKHRGK